MPEEIFLNTRIGEAAGARGKKKRVFAGILMMLCVLVILAGLWRAYDVFWLRHRYLITAYCDCPICVNVKGFRDGKFASMRRVYWGGVAADKTIPFGASVELMPFTPKDWLAIWRSLEGRRDFKVEDRGSKIRDRHIDIYFPQERGGHEAALRWGARRMRIKINGQWMT